MHYPILFIRLSPQHPNSIFPMDIVPPFDLLQAGRIIEEKHNLSSLLLDQCLLNLSIPKLVQKALSYTPRFIILSCISTKALECQEFFSLVKRHNQHIISIAVGHLATYCTQQICHKNAPIDFVIRGEFQIVLADFLYHRIMATPAHDQLHDIIFSHDSKNISRLHIINDINQLPAIPFTKKMLDQYHNIIPLALGRRIHWGRLFSSYGCPHQCVFCSQAIRLTYGSTYRTREISSIISEIKYLKKSGANVIEFSDDNFTASRKHISNVCQSVIDNTLNISWGAHARIDDLDYETLLLMKKSGCIFIRCGIESGSEKILSALKKTSNPRQWASQAKSIFTWCKELHILTIANIIISTPHETPIDIEKTKHLLFDLEPDIMQLHTLCIYPGSLMHTGHRPFNELPHMHHYNHFAINPDASALKHTWKEILFDFYLRPRYIIKNIKMFWLYYILNMEKTAPIIFALAKIFLKKH